MSFSTEEDDDDPQNLTYSISKSLYKEKDQVIFCFIFLIIIGILAITSGVLILISGYAYHNMYKTVYVDYFSVHCTVTKIDLVGSDVIVQYSYNYNETKHKTVGDSSLSEESKKILSENGKGGIKIIKSSLKNYGRCVPVSDYSGYQPLHLNHSTLCFVNRKNITNVDLPENIVQDFYSTYVLLYAFGGFCIVVGIIVVTIMGILIFLLLYPFCYKCWRYAKKKKEIDTMKKPTGDYTSIQ